MMDLNQSIDITGKYDTGSVFVCRSTPKRIEILSSDGFACEQIESSGSSNCTSKSTSRF